jgi:hypothetical protein
VVAVIAALTIPGRAAAAVPVTTSPQNPIVGQTLTAEVGTTPEPPAKLAYQWQSCTTDVAAVCAPITDATGAAYVVGAGDAGRRLFVGVTATFADETMDTGQSPPTEAVRAPPTVTPPTIAGTALVGETLEATATATGYPPPPGVTYEWLRCDIGCVPIAGAIAASYPIMGADAGYSLAVEATAQNELGAVTVRSGGTDRVEAPPGIAALTIDGDPAVGETLTAARTVTGYPQPDEGYRWLRCSVAAPDTCAMIDGARARSYKVVPADSGYRLAVRMRAVNRRGEDAEESQRTLPVPFRSGTFDQLGITVPPASGSNPTAQPLAGAPRLLRPFPSVRVKGRVAARGARVTLFRVRAPSGSKVVVRCRRPGCPLRRRSTRPGRIRTLERFLPAGIRLTIRVTKPGLIGKYVRLVIRGGSPPKRRDRCLMPGDPAPVKCPLA